MSSSFSSFVVLLCWCQGVQTRRQRSSRLSGLWSVWVFDRHSFTWFAWSNCLVCFSKSFWVWCALDDIATNDCCGMKKQFLVRKSSDELSPGRLFPWPMCFKIFFLTSFEHELLAFVGLLATGIGPWESQISSDSRKRAVPGLQKQRGPRSLICQAFSDPTACEG